MVATFSDRQEPLTVLLVEDNAADIMLMEEVIADFGIDVNLQVVTAGERPRPTLNPPWAGKIYTL